MTGLERCELLPCPFCGEAARQVPAHAGELQRLHPAFEYECSNNGCAAQPSTRSAQSWNRRAELARRVEGREADGWRYRDPGGEWRAVVDADHLAKLRKFVANGSDLEIQPLYTHPSDPVGLAEGFVAVPRGFLDALVRYSTDMVSGSWLSENAKKFLAAATPPAAGERGE